MSFTTKLPAQADFKKVLLGDRTPRKIGQCGCLAKLLGAS